MIYIKKENTYVSLRIHWFHWFHTPAVRFHTWFYLVSLVSHAWCDFYTIAIALRSATAISYCSYWFGSSSAGHGISSHGRRERGAYPSHNDIFTVRGMYNQSTFEGCPFWIRRFSCSRFPPTPQIQCWHAGSPKRTHHPARVSQLWI